MTLSPERLNPGPGSDSLLVSAADSMEASATTQSPYRRRQDIQDALAILEEATFNAALCSDQPSFHTARTLTAIAPIYGFRGYFASHVSDLRYTEAFAEFHLKPAQQAVRKSGRATIGAATTLGDIIKAGQAVTPNIIANQKRMERLRQVLNYQALLLQHLDPSSPQKFSHISLPDFLKAKNK